MASPDLSVFQRIKTKQDFDREAAEFLMKKQAAQRQLAGTDPAAVKLANELQAARAAGDVQRVNDLIISAKLVDRGVVMDANGRPMAMGGYGDAVGSIAGTKKAYEANAQNASDLQYDPMIAAGETAGRLGQQLQYEPQINAANKSATMKSEAATQAGLDLPGLTGKTDSMVTLLNEIENSPGLQSVVGLPNPMGGRIPFVGNISGSPAADFQAKLDQLGGANFLQAFESLKGGGQITEVEGKKATDAIAAMQTSQSEAAFKKELNRLREVIQSGLARKQMAASGGIPQMQMDGEELIPYNPTNMPSDIGLGNVNDDMPKIGKAEEAETIFNAKKAIQRGAPVESVRQRLIQNGIDPSKAGI